MKYLRKPRWALSENKTTPEAVFWYRRRVLLAGGGVAGLAALSGLGGMDDTVPQALAASPAEPYTPMPPRNPAYATAGRAITPERINTNYNNFYEFGFSKSIAEASQALPTEGWTVKIDGLVEQEREIGVDDMLARMPMEERVYRHRCVEGWSMVVPWIGYPLKALLAEAKPLSGAKYLRFETFMNPEVAREQRNFRYPWPYVEGMTIEEASNDLSFMVAGAYGKVLHKPMGAPLRLHLPWKYGFKSIKSITRISLVAERPVSFWEELQSSEYGFWANVNPKIAHPRWSQATERVLGTDERIETELYNGYGPEVASLYTGMEAEYGDRLWR
jgi:sulfoxide reductase catalytic subunit YedY